VLPLFTPRSVWAALPSGDVVVGNTHEATFHVFGPDGAPRGVVRLPLGPKKVPQSDKAEILKGYGALPGVRASGAPRPDVGERYPITNHLYPLNDTIFAMYHGHLSVAAGDPGLPWHQTVWRLVSTSGHYAGAIWFPPRFTPCWWGHGRVLGLLPDSLGVKTIQQYRLTPPDGTTW
jgi:hypothetical protein